MHAQLALVVVDCLDPIARAEGFDGGNRTGKDAAFRQLMLAFEKLAPKSYELTKKLSDLHALFLRVEPRDHDARDAVDVPAREADARRIAAALLDEEQEAAAAAGNPASAMRLS